jgi:radical SAM superfamily enzyme YgiQ (UPF0313 family)
MPDEIDLGAPLDVLFVNLPPVSPDLAKTDDPTAASTLHPPLGLMYLANAIQGKEYVSGYKCVDFAIRDFRGVTQGAMGDLVDEQLQGAGFDKPNVVAISLMFSSSYGFFATVVEQVKRIWPDTLVIVGGMHASNTVSYLLEEHAEIDYVVSGEGEDVFVDFLAAVASGERPELAGLHSLGNIKPRGKWAFEQTSYKADLDMDFSKYDSLIEMDKYTADISLFSLSKTSLDVRSFAVMSSRGCPYHCTFCASHTVHGHGMRHRGLQNLLDEIRWLNERYGVTKIYLMDDNFIPKKWVLELFDMFAEIDIDGFEVVIQNMSVNATDFDIIDRIAAAGISNIAFAIESGSRSTQKKIKKGVKLDKAFELVRHSQELGLNIRCFFIIGFPGETVAEMEETFDYAARLRADWSTFSVASPIAGSDMYHQFVELGCIEDGPSSWSAATLRDRTFDTAEIGARDIKELAYRANLKVNFIQNTYIANGDYENAEIVFSNFVQQYDFHLFAFDCLRRIYKETGRGSEERQVVSQMLELIRSSGKAQSFYKYFDLLDDDIATTLVGAMPEGYDPDTSTSTRSSGTGNCRSSLFTA